MRKKKKNEHEIDFWQSSSDLMTGLILVLLLIIALLALLLLRRPDDNYDNYNPEKHVETQHHEDDHDYDERTTDDGGGGGGGGDGGDEGDGPEDDPGEYPEENEGSKSAVYVTLIDGETEKPILEDKVSFDLHSKKSDRLQVLYNYYPVKTQYKKFETTANGTFYLPEKIPQGHYYFRNLTAATGYGKAENAEFEVDQYYDWPNPLVVKIPVYPERERIRISVVDTDTKESVPEASFNVIADEEIATIDGTVRFKKGDIADTIKCNKAGQGESKELFLGTYTLEQVVVPEYYASVSDSTSVEVTKEKQERVPIEEEKTALTLSLSDELTGTKISGAEFALVSDKEESGVTAEDGTLTFTNLNKETTYTITQKSTAEDYRMMKKDIQFTVDKDGKINGNAKETVEATNRKLRVFITVKDAVLRQELTERAVTLYDETGIVQSWVTNGTPQEFTNLKEGEYTVSVEPSKEQYPITIKDTQQEQRWTVTIWTLNSYLAVIGISLFGILLLYAVIRLLRVVHRKRKEKKQSETKEQIKENE